MVAAGGFACLACAAFLLLTLAAGQPAPQTASPAAQVSPGLDQLAGTSLAMPRTHPTCRRVSPPLPLPLALASSMTLCSCAFPAAKQ